MYVCVCVGVCKTEMQRAHANRFGPLTLTCINFAAIVICPRNANAAKAQAV